MSTNQNTTQDDLKKCLKKKNRINKIIAVLALVFILISVYCVNASAIVIQDISDTVGFKVPYPTLNMTVQTDSNIGYIEVSGAGKESGSVRINSTVGEIRYQSKKYDITSDGAYGGLYSYAEITTMENQKITSFYKSEPINIDMWNWYSKYNDSIIWQIWDRQTDNEIITNIQKLWHIQLPYFNNSEIMGTVPMEFDIGQYEQGYLITSGIKAYNFDLPGIDAIIDKAIEVMEQESQSNITFQYKGQQLAENNYITDVYTEEGEKINIDFKKALESVLIIPEYFIIGNITNISIVNYNNVQSWSSMSEQREEDFNNLVILNQFERSAEITMERKDKEVGLLNWLGNAISGIMNVEIFPNFSLGGILSVIIMIPVVIWILKLVAGG